MKLAVNSWGGMSLTIHILLKICQMVVLQIFRGYMAWYQYEFAVQRRSIHCHGVAKLESDPGLCQLTKIASKGFLAVQKRASILNDLFDIDSAFKKGRNKSVTT